MPEFADLATEFSRRVESTVWCTLATTDGANRPRTRIVHPVWDLSAGTPVGWLGSRPSLKLRHIERVPSVSLMYWDPRHEQVIVDADAEVHRDADTCRTVWDMFSSFPEPYGFDPAPIWPGGPEDDGFVAVRLIPRRLELFGAPPRVWRRDSTD